MNKSNNLNRKFIWFGAGLFILASVVMVSMAHPGYLVDHLRFVAGMFGFNN